MISDMSPSCNPPPNKRQKTEEQGSVDLDPCDAIMLPMKRLLENWKPTHAPIHVVVPRTVLARVLLTNKSGKDIMIQFDSQDSLPVSFGWRNI